MEYFVLFLCAEYIPGGTLKSLLQDTDKELSWLERIRITKDITEGMVGVLSVLVGYFNKIDI